MIKVIGLLRVVFGLIWLIIRLIELLEKWVLVISVMMILCLWYNVVMWEVGLSIFGMLGLLFGLLYWIMIMFLFLKLLGVLLSVLIRFFLFLNICVWLVKMLFFSLFLILVSLRIVEKLGERLLLSMCRLLVGLNGVVMV